MKKKKLFKAEFQIREEFAEDLVKELTHVFGNERVFVIYENTDFSKLPNPFLENSKKGDKKLENSKKQKGTK